MRRPPARLNDRFTARGGTGGERQGCRELAQKPPGLVELLGGCLAAPKAPIKEPKGWARAPRLSARR
eukprot:5823928-Alexandrium_andersonii.AAC.1